MQQQGEEVGLPVRAALASTGLYLALRPIDRDQLQDAFMQQTVARLPASDRIVHISRDHLGKAPRSAAPVGIIFHVARCGSTLISQSLKHLDDLSVYAEPQPVNELLAPPYRWPRGDIVAALRTVGAAFAHHARRPYVLKLSSWNTLCCDLVTEAFPESPWVLSLRDPVEVCVSLLRSPPGWFQPTSETARALLERVDVAHASRSQEEFVARAYGAFCEAAAGLETSRGRLTVYEDLPEAVWCIVAPHFGLAVDDSQRERILAAAQRHAKAAVGTVVEFTSDAEVKQKAASGALRSAIDSLARPQLERLMRLHADTMRG